MSIQFDLPKDDSSIIKVIGVGGGGSNAVNHMFRSGIVGVNFMVCNTDQQALDLSPVPHKVQLGAKLMEGRGAGMDPEKGRQSTLEAIEQIQAMLEHNTKMVFITAGMGKGTGTGGAPVIAKAAKEMGVLTIALVTTPFSAEGPKRFTQAHEGIDELRKYVDSILVISNDKLREIYGNLKLTDAFTKADDILLNGARGIAEIITVAGNVNVDFNDVYTVLKDSGVAIMGTALGEGEHRALQAVEAALNSPLLNDNDIRGAQNILLNITSGKDEVTLDEVSEIQEFIQRAAGADTNIIWGCCTNDSLGDKICVTVIATGFESSLHPRKETAIRQVMSMNKEENEMAAERENFDLREMEITKTKLVNKPLQNGFSNEIPFELEMNSADLPEFDLTSEKNPMQANDYFIKEKSAATDNDNFDANATGNERVQRLRSLSMKLRNPGTLNEMEREPAFQRRNVQLRDTPHSSESNASAYYVSSSEGGENAELKKNNSFLHGHDKVD
jgi:cell division protein FtsZ